MFSFLRERPYLLVFAAYALGIALGNRWPLPLAPDNHAALLAAA